MTGSGSAGRTADDAAPTLVVDFAGEVHELEPGDELTFGRGTSADLVIDSNPLLHRQFGRLFYRHGGWWLRNEGRTLPMALNDRSSKSSVTLSSGREVSVSFPQAAVAFRAGNSNYEILLDLPDDEPAAVLIDEDFSTAQGLTIDQSQVPLVGEQRLLAVAMCEPQLRDPHGSVGVPANKAVAHRFGWSMTTFNRKLDRLCLKFSQLGVSGLVGTSAESASDRRRKLVEHLIGAGVITLADLDLLEDAGGEPVPD